MKNHMKSLEEFKQYVTTSVFVPRYFRDYVNSLTPTKLKWFYNQLKEPFQFLKIDDYLIYKFIWIKERNFTDLSKEIYIESLYNPEGFTYDIIKPKWENILDERYKDDEDVKNYFNHF